MSLLNDNDLKSLINTTSKTINIENINIEKDYYICKILSEIEKYEDIDYAIFRGGTSLSKCWKVIDRFSEDIDFSIAYPIGEAKRRKFKYIIKEICDSLGLEIINFDKLRSKTAMNRYEIKYPTLFDNDN